MASKIGMSYRNEAAQERIDTALEGLTSRLATDVAPVPTNRRDPVLQETLRLEWMADVLEALGAEGGDPDVSGGNSTPVASSAEEQAAGSSGKKAKAG